MMSEIGRWALARGATRLCHFTPSRNLPAILDMGEVRSREVLDSMQAGTFIHTDPHRYDGYTNHISCSVEYPNPRYFATARNREQLFEDWVVLRIPINYLDAPDVLFCPVNAAKGRGVHVVPGLKGFQSLYENHPANSKSIRGFAHMHCCPTDLQAEVLIPNAIPIEDVAMVFAASETQALRESRRLRQMGYEDQWSWCVSPAMFDRIRLIDAIETGQRPPEWPV